MTTLLLDNLEYRYPGGAPVLQGFSVAVASGERVALTGDNGTGKSTTLRIAAGLIEPIGGGVKRRGTFGYATGGERGLLLRLSVRQNLAFFAALQGVSPEDPLPELGLTALMDRRVVGLSSGQKARVSLAVALVHGPSLLLLDEIDAGLDPVQLAAVDAVLRQHCAKGGAVLLATHRGLLQVDRSVEVTPCH
jgi:ABC-type multidrug transport system ATPase subunit